MLGAIVSRSTASGIEYWDAAGHWTCRKIEAFLFPEFSAARKVSTSQRAHGELALALPVRGRLIQAAGSVGNKRRSASKQPKLSAEERRREEMRAADIAELERVEVYE